MSASPLVSRARYTLAISVILTLILYKIPQLHTIAYPLVLISTLVHELGHGIAGLLVGGSFERFVMYADGSGLAHTSGQIGRAGRAFISAGGLVGPAVAAAGLFVFARRQNTARYCMAAIGVLLVLALILVVRNSYGLVFVGVFAGVCLLMAFKAGDELVQLGLVFLAVQLALSVYSRGDYLFVRTAETAQGKFASDTENMATAIGIGPYWFWGGVCAAFSVLVLLLGSWYFVRSAHRANVEADRA